MGVAGADVLLSLIKQKQDLQGYRERHWTGTLADYMEVVMANPRVARNAYQRLFDMILSHGVTEYTRQHERYAHYKLFDDPVDGGRDAVFGLDAPIMRLVHNIKSAAFGYGTEKRILLLHGPVGSSKATIARLMKKGVEQYSGQPEGALYTFGWKPDLAAIGHESVQWCPMHEDPLHLIPLESQEAVYAEINRRLSPRDYRIVNTGSLCPFCRKTFQDFLTQYEGSWEKLVRHVVVKRLILSEKDRVGIGTFQPKDEKNQDSTELTGDLNYRKIAEYGSDSDPRAFNFDGEFNVANRGMIEFVEVLKLDVAFLYDLLGASQEHRIKPKKFAQTYIDEVIIGHTNEPEYRKLQDNEFMEALRDRTVKIDIPYITKLRDEVKIYKKDFNSRLLRGVSIAPHTIEMAAMWAIMTRLEKPKKANLTRLQKLKLYDGKTLPNYAEDNIKELRKEAKREGLEGISPRYIQDKLSNALVMAQQMNKGSVNPFMVMNELESGLKHHSLIASDDLKQEYKELLSVVKQEYEEIIKSEVQRAI